MTENKNGFRSGYDGKNLRASWSEKWSASANWTPAGTQVVMAVCGTAHTALGIIQKKKKEKKRKA